ncbi:hypothetical protein B0H19DRAFT_705218 [Mycena capillaripes]|nr:hypothetical protein B0H19DRAFT_705218 [Mycena capillaripes]
MLGMGGKAKGAQPRQRGNPARYGVQTRSKWGAGWLVMCAQGEVKQKGRGISQQRTVTCVLQTVEVYSIAEVRSLRNADEEGENAGVHDGGDAALNSERERWDEMNSWGRCR